MQIICNYLLYPRSEFCYNVTMRHIKMYFLHGLVILSALAVIAGFAYVSKLPENSSGGFSRGAAGQDLLPFEELRKARVAEVLQTEETINQRYSSLTQQVVIELLEGPARGERILAEYDDTFISPDQKLKAGDKVVTARIQNQDEDSYLIVDRYRLDSLWWGAGLLVLLAIAFARLKGLASLAGLAFSLAILIFFVAPNLLAGKNPLLVSGVGSGAIALAAIFLAHGFSKRTMLAVVSTLATLIVTVLMAVTLAKASLLFGRGTDEAFYLQAGFLGAFNLQGLLLAGIIIGTLGVLDDVTTTQTAAVHEISLANPELGPKELYRRGISVGREHIASLINTLVLAYAGASLPLFLLFTTNTGQPLWALLNSEYLAEEIVRTVSGSASLILAVPISTFLAAKYFSKDQQHNI